MITSGEPFRIVRRDHGDGGPPVLIVQHQRQPGALLRAPYDEALTEALVTLRSCLFPDLWPSAAAVDFPASIDPSILSLAEAIGRGLARADFARMKREEK